LIDPDQTSADVYVIDEIGKMELLSVQFRQKVIDLLARPASLLGTIALRGRGFVEQLKSRNDVEVIEVTRENRDRLPGQIAKRILQSIRSPGDR
jgi:nucleoside-triphosphatase